jgi:hypothetical protein
MSFDNSNIRQPLIDSANDRHRKLDNSRSKYYSSFIYDYFSHSYGIAFFIEERRKHFVALDSAVFRTLAYLVPNVNPIIENIKGNTIIDIDNLTYLKIGSTLPIKSRHYRDALKHMQKDSPNLPSKIDSLSNDINIHNEKVDNLFLLIRSLITDSSKKSTNPLLSSSYKMSIENILSIFLRFWKEATLNHNTVREIQYDVEYRINSGKFKFDNNSGLLRLNDILVAEEKDNELVEIQSRLLKLIKNEAILSSYLELNKSKMDINKKMIEIQEIAKEISDDIQNNKYTQKAECCPTILKLIRNYFF